MTKRLIIISILLWAVTLTRAAEPGTEGAYFRGAWIATVANIDWPSRESQGNTLRQQRELIEILDSLHAIGINAVIFQTRPTADALYDSELEPVSSWLTGKQGSWGEQMPWDPLEFIVTEAHQRNMEVHAWLNPYRVNIGNLSMDHLAQNHVMRMHPEWFWKYGTQWYFEPGLDDTREWICMVVEDIVTRYDIDAIHMDDYFYPYPIGGQSLPDRACFEANPRGFVDIRDWRRNNINLAIEQISRTIKQCKPEVEFGISPFGVWRNASRDSILGSATRAGITNYDDLYADILLWMREGWIDYVLPQLYWEIGKPNANYEVLAHWWADRVDELRRNQLLSTENISDEQMEYADVVKLYIGMAPYRLGGEKEPSAWRNGNEIVRQMRLNRTIPEISGECFYSTRPLLKNPKHVCDSIRAIYQEEY